MAPQDSPIRRARQAAGRTLKEVADAIGVSERSVMRWELGQTEPPVGSAVRLARFLRRRVEDLVRVA